MARGRGSTVLHRGLHRPGVTYSSGSPIQIAPISDNEGYRETDEEGQRDVHMRLGEESLGCCHPQQGAADPCSQMATALKAEPDPGRGVDFILLLRQRTCFTSRSRFPQAMANTQDAGAIVESWYSTESDLS
jgi:hypothetical protein